MPLDTRNSGNGGRESDDWLSGAGEFDWGDEPTGPLGTRTAPGRGADEPLWPSAPGVHPDEATIRRRRAVGLIAALVVVGAIIVFAVVALGGGSDGDTTTTVTPTTTQQPATPPPPPPPATQPNTPTTPAAASTVTLPGGEPLQTGSTGAAVTKLQQALVTLGYEPGTPDGDYGAATAAAVGQFQRDNGLADDGVAGPATVEAINAALAEQATG
jgi:hypothetical protein